MQCSMLYRLRKLGGKNFLVSSGDAISLSEVGSDIWRMLKSGSSRSIIVDAIVNEYGVDVATAQADTDEFIAQLINLGVVTEPLIETT